jgi:hypothetical protein
MIRINFWVIQPFSHLFNQNKDYFKRKFNFQFIFVRPSPNNFTSGDEGI